MSGVSTQAFPNTDLFTIVVVGVGCENSTFSPLNTSLEDFATSSEDQTRRLYAQKITGAKAGTRIRLGSDSDGAPERRLPRDFSDVRFRFASRFRAIPGGEISRDAFQIIKETTRKGLESACKEEERVDGVWLDLHGAMKVEGSEDAEGILASLVRDIVGKEPLVCASFDLHGNFSSTMANHIDICTAYRTAPHIDVVETRIRAVHLLVSALRARCRPVLSYLRIPLVISGEMSNTADEPSKSLYSKVLEEVELVPGILDASLLVGYCWADEPRSGASVLVTSEAKDIGDRMAIRIATEVWKVRNDFKFSVPSGSVKSAVDMAMGSKKPVVISDSGDNPTAGGVGDTPSLLREIANREYFPFKTLVQGPVDLAAVAACISAGVGSSLQLSLGGKLDNINDTPFDCFVTVKHAHPQKTVYSFVDEGNEYPTSMPPTVVVCLESNPEITVVITSERKPLHYVADFQHIQLDLERYDVLVLKLGYLVPDIERFSKSNVMALSPGAVYADLPRLPYKKIPRPFFPKDPSMTWVPSALL